MRTPIIAALLLFIPLVIGVGLQGSGCNSTQEAPVNIPALDWDLTHLNAPSVQRAKPDTITEQWDRKRIKDHGQGRMVKAINKSRAKVGGLPIDLQEISTIVTESYSTEIGFQAVKVDWRAYDVREMDDLFRAYVWGGKFRGSRDLDFYAFDPVDPDGWYPLVSACGIFSGQHYDPSMECGNGITNPTPDGDVENATSHPNGIFSGSYANMPGDYNGYIADLAVAAPLHVLSVAVEHGVGTLVVWEHDGRAAWFVVVQ